MPKVEEAELLKANPNYVHVCLQNSCVIFISETVISLKQVFTVNFNVEVINSSTASSVEVSEVPIPHVLWEREKENKMCVLWESVRKNTCCCSQS